MIPVVAVVAAAAEDLLAAVSRWMRSRPTPAWRHRVGRAAIAAGLVVLLGTVLGSAGYSWHRLYADRTDDGYSGVVAAVSRTVPAGDTIGVPRSMLELLHFAYPSQYRLLEVVTAAQVRAGNIRWYVMSSKDPDLGDLTPSFYADVAAHATLRWSFDGTTFRRIGLWSVDPSALTSGGQTP
jgi:hypothetical protein